MRLFQTIFGPALMLMAGVATAGTVDFTASSNTSGSVADVGWQLTASAGDAITFETSDAPGGAVSGLAGLNDGVGLNDDEISNGTSGEFLTITFDRVVRVTAFSVLDLFRESADEGSPESAYLFAGGSGSPDAVLAATEVFSPGGFGFGSASVDLVGDTFTFRAGSGNDGVGTGDFSLASITFDELAAIPLPASLGLLGTAFLGMFWTRRRQTRQQKHKYVGCPDPY